MGFNFDKVLGVHEKALYLRSQRTAILASNIANADTPNYKAKDIDFRSILSQSKQTAALPLAHNNPRHISNSNRSFSAALQYRNPNQASLDGNTVDPQLEKAAFSENSVRYQATLQLLGGKFKGLLTAIKGN
ncbi:MAG: flagellar basal body rod protein FlgB [Gammaproteobacteria bacterium]|nr:flagellar basal body rod protein FlgB [Gammaproteobacteria bacterium]